MAAVLMSLHHWKMRLGDKVHLPEQARAARGLYGLLGRGDGPVAQVVRAHA